MYTVIKTLEVSGAHKLDLPYESKCKNLHGHNWKIKVFCKSNTLNSCGMVIDFTHIKKWIMETFDHAYINNKMLRLNPTAENIAKMICHQFDCCYKVEIEESEGNLAIYEREL